MRTPPRLHPLSTNSLLVTQNNYYDKQVLTLYLVAISDRSDRDIFILMSLFVCCCCVLPFLSFPVVTTHGVHKSKKNVIVFFSISSLHLSLLGSSSILPSFSSQVFFHTQFILVSVYHHIFALLSTHYYNNNTKINSRRQCGVSTR